MVSYDVGESMILVQYLTWAPSSCIGPVCGGLTLTCRLCVGEEWREGYSGHGWGG
jgi:hypothetical protein